MIRRIIKYTGILLGIDAALFIALVLMSMTDERPPAMAGYIGWVLKYPLGFPLVLVNENYPYFIDKGNVPLWCMITLALFNDLLLALGIAGLISLFKRTSKAEK